MFKFLNRGISTPIAIGIIAILVTIVGGGTLAYQYWWLQKSVACTKEAKVCPDGSAVGRTGPHCEFTACPDQTADWKTYTNNQYGFSIKYPPNYKLESTTYGWSNAVALFGGPSGQSYYLAIEVWNNESEFNATRGYNVQPQPVFKQIGNQYISLWNVNKDLVVDQILSTFKFLQENETSISIWPDVESFDLNAKTFEGKIWGKEQKVKILTTESTKFYRTAEQIPQYNDSLTFSEFYSLVRNWSGTYWPFTIKGILEKEGVIKANEVFLFVQ